MIAYMIEMWQVEAGKEGERPEPERRDFDTTWFYRNSQQDALWNLFHRSAGVNWMRTTELLYRAGLIDIPRGHVFLNPPDPEARSWSRDVMYSSRESMKNALAQRVRKFRRDNDLADYTNIHPSVYQRSYAWGFVDEIRDRFHEMRNEQREEAEEEGCPFDIVIRGIDQAIDDMANEMFGEEPKSRSLAMGQIDYRAHVHGREAGARARIEVHTNKRVGSRKELTS